MKDLNAGYVPNPAARAGSGKISKIKEQLVSTSVRLPADLLKRAKVYAALNGGTLKQMITESLSDWLDHHENN